MKPLPRSFYLRPDVVTISRELLGKYLVTSMDGKITAGMITETEAYEGITDKASHAYGNRMTKRTEVMYRRGGISYVYLCYGIHSLFNLVTNEKGIPHAVLIRGIIPAEGTGVMLSRAGKSKITTTIGDGPGKVSTLLGIHFSHSGLDICHKPSAPEEPGIWLEDRGVIVDEQKIITSPRIGVAYAGADALLPYRFEMGK